MEGSNILTEEEVISEGAEYSPKSEFSKPKLVEDAVRDCRVSRSQEMTKGYWNTKVTKEGFPIRTWVNDTRKTYIATVDACLNLLSPEIREDQIDIREKKLEQNKNMPVEELQKDNWRLLLKEKRKEIFDRWAYAEMKLDYVVDSRPRLVYTGRKYIPDVDDLVQVQNIKNPSSLVEMRGAWNNYVNNYWNEMVELYDQIFSEINDLIHRLNYFKYQINFG